MLPPEPDGTPVSQDDLDVTDPRFDLVAARAEDREAALLAPREDVRHVEDLDVRGVPVRWYRPVEAPAGLVVHLHGGGFVFNDVEVHDPHVRRLANRSGLAVLSVEYRRPPEDRFPAAVDDVSTVVEWLDDGGLATLRLPADVPVFGHGDSAGANLALVAALRHPGRFAGLVLIYPFLDPTLAGASYEEATEGFDAAEARWYWEQYAGSPDDLTHPDLAPLLSDGLAGLPATLVATAENDPCRDDGETLVTRLADLGVEVVGTRYLGVVHGFWRRPEEYDAAEC
ncbi:alpha/beta hydrolase [Nocardioides daphniae]|uniref:alpha/beta hydrolase n=1 Tax=Nocardioides daphniae TaxID=402297 RepID=UPI001EE85D7A|nr:alpha/beta hydrolase [Nocardioides daphniae]